MSSTSSSTDEFHARELATAIPKRMHTHCIVPFPWSLHRRSSFLGENHRWCQAGMIALGKETQDEAWKAQKSFWDSAALPCLDPCTYPTGVCNWRTFTELDAYELHAFLHLYVN